VIRDLFAYRRRGTDENGREKGEWVSSGVKPRFLAKLEKAGLTIPADVYAEGTD
jgi:pilus assembly protein CpaF